MPVVPIDPPFYGGRVLEIGTGWTGTYATNISDSTRLLDGGNNPHCEQHKLAAELGQPRIAAAARLVKWAFKAATGEAATLAR
jgi:hypothetical protein